MWVPEGVGQAQAEDKARCDGESAHEYEQPEPTRFAAHTVHVQDTKGEQFCGSLTELIPKVEDHDTFGSFFASVPCRQCPQAFEITVSMSSHGCQNMVTLPPGMKPDSVMPRRRRVVMKEP